MATATKKKTTKKASTKASAKSAAKSAPKKATQKVAAKKPAAKKTATKKVVAKKSTNQSAAAQGQATVNLVKRGLLIGLGAAVQTGTKVKGVVEEQVKQLMKEEKISATEAKKFGKEIAGLVTAEKKNIENKINESVDAQLKKLVKSLKLVTKDDLKEFKKDMGKTSSAKPAKKAAPKKTAARAASIATTAKKKPAAAKKKATTKKVKAVAKKK